MSVLVGVPVTVPDFYGEFRSRVVGAIEGAVAEASGIVDATVFVTPKTKESGQRGIVEATNFLAEKCLDGGYDFLWIVEADVEVPSHALVRLLSGDSDVSVGIYPNHREDLLLMCGFFEEQLQIQKPIVQSAGDLMTLRGRVFEGMVWAGVGCCLVSRRVFEFGLRFMWDPLEYRRIVGLHDMLFLFAAQLNGFRVLLRGDVLCGHLPEWPLEKVEKLARVEAGVPAFLDQKKDENSGGMKERWLRQ